MACGHGGGCACGGPPRFTRFSDMQMGRTLAQKLIPVVDKLRDLYTRFGLRPYVVRIVRTGWTGARRGVGNEYETLVRDVLPTPKILNVSALAESIMQFGRVEIGSIEVVEVSGSYTEDDLRGLNPDGSDPDPNGQVFYEVEFPRADGRPGERRRFTLKGAPEYLPDKFQWHLSLEKANQNRERDGSLP